MKITGGDPQSSGRRPLPATHRDHFGRIGGDRRRLFRGVHDELESVIILAGIRNPTYEFPRK
jgi:hypothetical protein